jgi:hypothetical protein
MNRGAKKTNRSHFYKICSSNLEPLLAKLALQFQKVHIRIYINLRTLSLQNLTIGIKKLIILADFENVEKHAKKLTKKLLANKV